VTRSRRWLGSAVAASLAMGVVMMTGTAPPAAATVPSPTVTYDSIGSSVPGNVGSVGFEARSVREFGDLVRLAPGGRLPNTVRVELSSWGCEDGTWSGGDCSTSNGATFTHDLTLNLYAVNHGGPLPAPGTLLVSQTTSFAIPFRPSADSVNCTGGDTGRWFDAGSSTCFDGLATAVTFDLSANTTVLPSEVIWTLSFDTTHAGPSPIGEGAACFSESGGCGYDYLQIGTETLANQPSKGLDVDPDGVFQNSTSGGSYCDGGSGGTGTLRDDTSPLCWFGSTPLARISTRVASAATTNVMVSQVDQHGWSFAQEAPSGSGSFVAGPSSPPAGIGSGQLVTSSSGRENANTAAYAGTPLDRIVTLGYHSLRQSFDAAAQQTVALQLDVDYDTTGGPTTQGRLVFDPFRTVGGTIAANSWYQWSPLDGQWWASQSPGNGVCPQSNPCGWLELLQAFPKAGISAPGGLFRLSVGPVSGGFTGNLDAVNVGVDDGAGNVAETVFDFESAPTITILNSPSVVEGDTKTHYLKFQVAPSSASAQTISAVYTATAGTATKGSDFVATTGTLSWPALDTSTKVVSVPVKPDLSYEDNETLTLVLSSPVNTLLGPPAPGTIFDNDQPPRIRAANAKITEGNRLDKVVTAYVRLGPAAGKTVTVDYTTQDDTATAGLDYLTTSGTLTFMPGQTQKPVKITIKGDFDVEGNETFFLVISNPTNGVIGESTGTITIVDND